LMERGAAYEDRKETRFLPAGVAWYGRRGTGCKLDGLELWAYV